MQWKKNAMSITYYVMMMMVKHTYAEMLFILFIMKYEMYLFNWRYMYIIYIMNKLGMRILTENKKAANKQY
jgi:hypothetical protein